VVLERAEVVAHGGLGDPEAPRKVALGVAAGLLERLENGAAGRVPQEEQAGRRHLAGACGVVGTVLPFALGRDGAARLQNGEVVGHELRAASHALCEGGDVLAGGSPDFLKEACAERVVAPVLGRRGSPGERDGGEERGRGGPEEGHGEHGQEDAREKQPRLRSTLDPTYDLVGHPYTPGGGGYPGA